MTSSYLTDLSARSKYWQPAPLVARNAYVHLLSPLAGRWPRWN